MLPQSEIIERNRLLLQALRGGIELRFGGTILQSGLCHYTQDNAGIDTFEHRHPHYELSLLLAGRMHYSGEKPDGESVTLDRPGLDWILIAPGLPHRRRTLADGSLLLGFALKIKNDSAALQRSLRKRLLEIDGGTVQKLTEQLELLFRSQCQFRAERLRLLLSETLLEFFAGNFSAQLHEEQQAGCSLDPLELVDHYIEENLTRRITADDIARTVGISRRHLYRLFTEKHGLPLKEYIIRQRLSRAAAALTHTGKPVKEIAAMTGFHNLSYFTRQFRRIFIQPPATYRRHGG